MNAVEGIVAERQRLWLTTDGGISWLDVLTLPSEIRNLQLEDDGTGFVMTADGEIFRGSNRGRDWTRIATELGKPFSETMYARGAIEWILVGENGFVAETKDAGASLQVVSSGIRFNMAEPSFASPQVGVSLGYPVDSGPLIGRTTDGGVSWNFEPSPLLQPVALEFLDSSIGVLLDESGLVMRSTNQGLSWTDASPIAQFTSFHRLALLDARTWLACGENSAIQRTEDAGQNWRIVNADLDGGLPLFDLDFFPDTSVGLAINPDGVFRSEDAGRSWGALEEDLSWGGGKRIVCLDQQTAISGFHEIVRTTDQGRSWITVFTPANTIRDIAFFDALHGIAVDSGGIHVRPSDGGLSWRPARAAFDVISGVAFRDQNSTVSVGEGGTMILGSRPRGR